MGNSTREQFFAHFSYLVQELYRLLLPGRVVAVHCAELPVRKQDAGEVSQYDFPGDLIRCFEKHGFLFQSRHVIWKDPLVMFMRTKTMGLAHKQIVKDSAMSRMGNPDYILGFRKPGVNPKLIGHPRGLRTYHGARKIPHEFDRDFTKDNDYDGRKDKRSHWIWQQYASPVWMDIRQMKVLPYKGAREQDDEKHVCPLQLDVIERCLELWSTEGDVVLSPFMGVGSEVYCAVKRGRKGLGVELKPSYFRQAERNLRSLDRKQQGMLT